MEERIPPQDLEAEQSVLGAMMISKDAIAAVSGRLRPESFYREAHGSIFKAIVDLAHRGEPADLVTISNELKKSDLLDAVGGKSYLAEIANAVPTAANAEHYGEIVQEKSTLRRLITAGTEIVQEAFEDSLDVGNILGNAQRAVLEISKDNIQNDFVPMSKIIGPVWDKISDSYDTKNGILGVSTGFKDLDSLLSGFQKSDLIILAARPAMGKTTLAMNFATNIALQSQKAVGVFSLEMPKEQLALRMLCSEAKVDMGRIRTANIHEHEYKGLSQALGRLSEAPIYIDDTAGISPLELRAKCRRLQMETDLAFVVIDYLQLMRSGKKKVESRFQEVSEIVREVKGIAKELQIPILALSQLSRDVEKRGDTRPKLSDLRESGEIEQTADIVMFIQREDYYDQKGNGISPTTLMIAKQRNGPTGDVELVFRKDVSRFEMSAKGFTNAAAPQVPAGQNF